MQAESFRIVKSRSNTLKETHFLEWKSSAVSQEIIELNVNSISGDIVYERLCYGVSREDRRNDGRLSDKHLNRYKLASEGGWYCSGIDLTTLKDSEWGCFKPDKPRKSEGKIIKYEHPCSVPTELFALKVPDNYWKDLSKSYQFAVQDAMSFWEWVAQNPVPVLITEGAKKAACLLTLGCIAIALPGINNGIKDDEVHPQIKALTKVPREFVFCFDQDTKWQTKINITQAIKKLARALEHEDCDSSVLVWDTLLDGEGKGIDDFIVKNPDLAKFYSLYDSRLSLESYLEKFDRVKKLDKASFGKFLDSSYRKRLAFNELTSRVELDGKSLELSGEIAFNLIEEHMIDTSVENIIDGFLYTAKKSKYHPVARYLSSCERKEHISIVNLANRYLGIEESDPNSNLYNIFVFKWLIAAVARIFQPGCKFDHALILQGGQGIGKSSFFSILGGDWYDSSANANVENTKTLMVFHRCWIQEWDEFDKVSTKTESNILKSFITNSKDRFVRPYGRDTIDHPRRFVIGGTVNKKDFLLDETGNRRYLIIPLPLGFRVPLEQLREERDSIWGTAFRVYLQGKKDNKDLWRLTPEEERVTNEVSSQFMTRDPWEAQIEQFVQGREKVSVSLIMFELFHFELKEQEPKYQKRIVRVLISLGWHSDGKQVRDPISGKRERLWYPAILT
jgi:predicted P-loop ATPase